MAALFQSLVAGSFCWFIASSLWIYPHSLSYFNESIGGPLNGARHLLGSNFDWGQDLRYIGWWAKVQRVAPEIHFSSLPKNVVERLRIAPHPHFIAEGSANCVVLSVEELEPLAERRSAREPMAIDPEKVECHDVNLRQISDAIGYTHRVIRGAAFLPPKPQPE